MFVRMSDGHEVFVREYEPTIIKGHVHILHGMAEHSARYDEFAQFLQEAGYYVTLHDHRGHGETAERNGTYGYFAEEAGFHRVVIDAHEVIEAVRKNKELPPLQLIGHSMGSFIARRYIQQYEVANVILVGTGAMSPLHQVGTIVAKALAKQQGKAEPSPLLNELSFGGFNKKIKNPRTEYDWICCNEKAVDAYIADAQCGFIATNQFYADLTEGILTVSQPREMMKIPVTLPVLLISGSEDAVGENGKGVMKVGQQMADAGVETVCVHLVEGMRHEIMNEENRMSTYRIMLRWLQRYE